MMHSYHAAARSGSAAVPTVDRSASDSVTHKTQLKQIQKKICKNPQTHNPVGSWRQRHTSSWPFCPMTIPNTNLERTQQQGAAAN